jgi:hypothetical protein
VRRKRYLEERTKVAYEELTINPSVSHNERETLDKIMFISGLTALEEELVLRHHVQNQTVDQIVSELALPRSRTEKVLATALEKLRSAARRLG